MTNHTKHAIHSHLNLVHHNIQSSTLSIPTQNNSSSLAAASVGPACTIDIVLIEKNLVPTCTGLRWRFWDGKGPICSRHRNTVRVTPFNQLATKLPVHRIGRVIAVAAVENLIDGFIIITLPFIERRGSVRKLN